MARRTLRTVGIHGDGSDCTHKVNTRGKPSEAARAAGCIGRTGYKATCTCGWHATKYLRLLADEARAKHATTHTAAPAAVQAS